MDSWWVTNALETRGPAYLLSHIFWVIFSIVLHELAHGWTAVRSGDDTPIATGHMTWNPAVHMGTFGLIVFALTGFVFGAMPINPRRFRGRYDDAKVAFAGPEVNFILAFGSAIALAFWVRFGGDLVQEAAYSKIIDFFWIGAWLNFFLALFNLIPVEPLDGATVLARFSRTYRNLFMGENARNISMMLFIVVFVFASTPISRFAGRLTKAVSEMVLGWIA